MRDMKQTSTVGIVSLPKIKYVMCWISALFLWTVIGTPQAFSENQVIHVILTENPDHLLDVTRRSMAVEMQRAGMEVKFREFSAVDGMNPEQVSDIATSGDVQYVALLRFDAVGERASFEMAIYDGETGRTLARLDRENVPVELEYDTIVAKSARALLAEAGLWFDRPESVPASVVPPDGQGGDDPGTRQIITAPESGKNGFAVSVGIAPLFVTGKASDYLKFGFLGALTFGYRIRLKSAMIELGLLGGVGRLYPEDASSVDVYLAPFGPSVRLETASMANVRVGIRVSGGAAFLSVRNPTQSDVAKLVPYALGGVEVSYQVSRSVLVRLESNYTVFFEEVHPIMAFSPTLAITWQPLRR